MFPAILRASQLLGKSPGQLVNLSIGMREESCKDVKPLEKEKEKRENGMANIVQSIEVCESHLYSVI